MPRYTRSISFRRPDKSNKNDPEVNRVLDHIRQQGGEIIQIDTLLAGGFAQTTLVYIVHYEAPQAIG